MYFKAFALSSLFVVLFFGIPNFVEEPGETISTPPRNFSESKRIAEKLFQDHRITFYCGCEYDKEGMVDPASCGYKPKSHSRRTKLIEWEHIMPAHRFGHHLPCWKKAICRTKEGKPYKGRRCCQKIDKRYIQMEADLHNLVPAIGELNSARSNYAFGLLPNIKGKEFGACEIKIDTRNKKVEPKENIRGTIARAYFYMSSVYKIELTDKEQALFKIWSNQYPPEKWEIEWDFKVSKIQGNNNPFIRKND